MKNSILKLLLLLLFILIIPTFISIVRPGSLWDMHDDMQIIRQVEMEKCLLDGQIPCRWTPDLGFGYGFPLFNYYPPMPYFVGQIFRGLSFSFVDTIKITAITQIVLSAFFMYLLVSSIYGKLGGLLSALFYTYAPYHAVNIYVRGAMNEAWAAVFFPLIFYYSKKLIETQKIHNFLGLSLAFSGLLLSHNPMVLAFTPIFFVWCIYWMFLSKKYVIIKLGLSLLLSLGLSSFFTLPVLFETKLVQVESLFTGYYNYSAHFVSVYQLFINNFWGNGHSVWGLSDGMSFSIGYLHWLIPFIMIVFLIYKFYQQRKFSKLELTTLLFIILGLFTAFMTHERSTFIWQLFSPLQKLQFPWRYLNVTNFLFSLSVGFLPLLLKKLPYPKIRPLLFGSIIIILLIINIPHFIPLKYYQTSDQQKLSGESWVIQTSGSINDFLPVTAVKSPINPAKEYVDQIIPSGIEYQLSGLKKGTDWQFFNIKLNKPGVVYLSELAFPEFEITNNGNPISYQIEPEFGRISLSLDAGQHQIYLKLRNTPLRNIANIISLFSVTIILTMFITTWKKTK